MVVLCLRAEWKREIGVDRKMEIGKWKLGKRVQAIGGEAEN
jgi:hypothetical protein